MFITEHTLESISRLRFSFLFFIQEKNAIVFRRIGKNELRARLALMLI